MTKISEFTVTGLEANLEKLRLENEQLQNRINELEKYVDDNENYKEKFHLVNSWVVNKEMEVNKPSVTVSKESFEEAEKQMKKLGITTLSEPGSIELLIEEDPFFKRLVEIEEGRKKEEKAPVESGSLKPSGYEVDEDRKVHSGSNKQHYPIVEEGDFHADDVPVGGIKEDE